jgi:hypothetical protein
MLNTIMDVITDRNDVKRRGRRPDMSTDKSKIYDDTVHKFTMNIPLEIFDQAKDRSRKLCIPLSIYLRKLIELDLNNNLLISEDVLAMREQAKEILGYKYRREMEQKEKAEKNQFKKVFLNFRNLVDRLGSRQLYFNWNQKDVHS